jgi:hypothetical protein
MENQKPAQSGQPEEIYRHSRRHHHSVTSGYVGGVFFILLGILLFWQPRTYWHGTNGGNI